jgi:large subunit ribosomal protein L30
MLRIKLVKSTIGNTPRNRATVAALGLRKLQQTVEHADTPTIRGMVHHVKHLLQVEEVEGEPTKKSAPWKAKTAKAVAEKPVRVAKPKAEKAPVAAKAKAEKAATPTKAAKTAAKPKSEKAPVEEKPKRTTKKAKTEEEK